MELAVVSVPSPTAVLHVGNLERVVRRLASPRRAQVVSTKPTSSSAAFLARRLDAVATTVATIDFDDLVASHAGSSVVVVCDATLIRNFAARVLAVAPARVPIPRAHSITVVRASRSGTRSLMCLNDTMHLVLASHPSDCVAPEGQSNLAEGA